MYPRDAISLYVSTTTAGTWSVLPASTTPYTLLYSDIYTAVAGESRVLVGTNVINRVALAGAHMERDANYVFTNQAVNFSKLGTGTSTASIIYVPRNRQQTPDPVKEYATSTNFVATSTTILNWQFSTSTNILNWPTNYTIANFPALQDIFCTNCSNASSSTSSPTYMDASTTQLYQSNLHMQNTMYSVGLWVLVVFAMYWLMRKLF